MIVFLDTSVLLRWLFKSHNAYPDFLNWKKCYASDLIWIEGNRVLNRIKLENKINDLEYASLRKIFNDFYLSINIVELDENVKNRACDFFPTIIGTLDAIHLSSALLLKEQYSFNDLVLLTHDDQLKTAAMAMNFRTVG